MFANTDQLRFTFTGSGMAVYPPGSAFGPRVLHDFEFVWITAGNVQWEVDGQTVAATPGTVLLARPGQRDSFRWDPRRSTRHGYFHFHLHQRRAKLPPPQAWPLSRQMADDDILRPLLHHLGWLLGRDDTVAKEQAQGVMRQILVAYLSGLMGTGNDRDDVGHPLIEGALAYVQERWADGDLEPITLGDLARAVDVSKTHLNRLFHSTLGVSPIEALRQVRLDRAVTLLTRTSLPIHDIATRTGFPNPFHFSKVFSTVYGSSPRAFRAGVLRGDLPSINKLARTTSLAEQVLKGTGLPARARR
jgi:AraC family transcriptional regulator